MTEKTEAQIDREKAAVAAMKSAKSNMEGVLLRVATLERTLSDASSAISRLKRHVGQESVMKWHDGSYEQVDLVSKYADEQVAKIAKAMA
jgi:hypothetical protein